MKENVFLFLLIFLAVDAIALLVLLIYRIHRELKRERIRHYGDRAEKAVAEYLQREFPSGIVLNNVYLKTGRSSSTQLDHILLSKWGIFVIETKSHNGRIETRGREWIQYYGEKVVRFHSPLLQNKKHCDALRYVLQGTKGTRGIPVTGLVVFTSDKVSFSTPDHQVLKLSQLGPYIKSGGKTKSHRRILTADPHRSYLSTKKLKLAEKAIRKARVKSIKRKRDHTKKVRALDHNRY